MMRRLFTRGLIALLPMAATIVILYFVCNFLYANIGVPLGEAVKWAMIKATGQTADYLERESWFFRSGAPVAGLVIGIVLVFLTGMIVATFLGKRAVRLVEALVRRTPVIGVVYPYAKQFTEFFSPGGAKKAEFKNAVAIPFPYAGVYSIGFVTADGMRFLNDATKKTLLTVFVPHSPTPFTGVVCYVPREEVLPLPITVDEALRIVISCGVLTPPHQAVTLSDFAAAAAREGIDVQKVAPGAPKSG